VLQEQTVALCIGQKLVCPVLQTGASNFSIKPNFLDSIRNLMLAALNCSPIYFHPWKHAAQ
jgi:hypothetical protein